MHWTGVRFFAHDIVFMESTKEELHAMLDVVATYRANWKLKLKKMPGVGGGLKRVKLPVETGKAKQT